MELMFSHGGITNHLLQFFIVSLELCLLVDMTSNFLIFLGIQPLQLVERLAMRDTVRHHNLLLFLTLHLSGDCLVQQSILTHLMVLLYHQIPHW